MRVSVPGGRSAASTPDGHNVTCIWNDRLVYGRVDVPLPFGQNVQYLDLSPDGSRFAGIGHDGPVKDRAMEFDGAWRDRGPAYGPFGVKYDRRGNLHIVQPPVAHGYRYVTPDNQLVTAEATYADPVRRIWAFTEVAGVTIGQGGAGPDGEDPCIVLIDGERRLLEPGRCRAITAKEEHGMFAISMTREDVDMALHFWLTRAELAALPLVTSSPVIVPPDPVAPPDPEPTPMPRELSSEVLDAVMAIDERYPHLLRENTSAACGEFTERVVLELSAADPKFGHVGKQPGQTQYRGHAVDAVMYDLGDRSRNLVWDIIGGAENHPHAGSPQANLADNGGQPWMAAIALPDGELPKPPDAPPVVTPPASCNCAAELAKLREDIADIERLLGELANVANARLTRLEQNPEPKLKPFRLKARTSRDYGHAHSINVEVVPE
jgi:hypothetical protein